MRRLGMLCGLALGSLPAVTAADEAEDAFVAANVLGIFYHELGHAVIDIEQVPIFGQEEDAADVFSIFLIDALFDEEAATDLAYDAALGFWGEVLLREADGYDASWWGVHGADEQRFYNTVCLFYGANPAARETFAEDMELPPERAEYCPDEYDLAAASWGGVLDVLETRQSGKPIVFEGGTGFAADILREEVALLAEDMRFATTLRVTVEPCGEANAYYYFGEAQIVFCTEFEPHLRRMYQVLQGS